MKKLFISVLILSPLFAGAVKAEDYPGQQAANALINQCRQEGMAKGVDDIDSYISECLDKKMQYDNSD
jgi:hypothetical protein